VNDLKIYTHQTHVHAYEADFNDNLKFSSLFNHMQDAATVHATRLGVGFEQLGPAGLFWVLAWVHIEMQDAPAMGVPFSLKTWAKTPHKLYSMRDFRFETEAGVPFARATTAWLLLNMKSKRPLPLKRLPIEIDYQYDYSALDAVPEKMTPLTRSDWLHTHRVQYADLDLNNHVNNARYVEVLMNAYPFARHEQQRLSALTLHYQAEAKAEDVIEVAVASGAEEEVDQVQGTLSASGQSCFRAALQWRKIEAPGLG